MEPVEKIDFDSMPAQQRDVFAQIAMNRDQGHPPNLIHALKAKKLIVLRAQGKFQFWEVPTWIHIQWCEWCSENYDDEGNRKVKP